MDKKLASYGQKSVHEKVVADLKNKPKKNSNFAQNFFTARMNKLSRVCVGDERVL